MMEIFGINYIDFIIILWGAGFTSAMSMFLFFKWRQKGTIPVEVLTIDKKYRNKRYKKADDNKLKIKDIQPNFTPSDFFEEEKPFWKFWRVPKRKLLWVEGTSKVVTYKEIKRDEGDLTWYWSRKDIQNYIKKEIAKAKTDVKPISRMEFVMIMIFLIILVVLNIVLLNNLRVF
jgi:hypothetical protein